MPFGSEARLTITCALLAWVALACLCARAEAAESTALVQADVILRGGVIYTADPARPNAEAVALAHGRIIAVGSDDVIARHAGDATRIVDLHGRMVLPGLHDAHVHPMSAGIWFLRCQLGNAKDARQLRSSAAACDANLTDDQWLIARGWREDMFDGTGPSGGFDGLVLQHPTVLLSAQGDRMWLNSRALEQLGLVDEEAVGDGIERDGLGKPNGFVHGAAAAKVRQELPAPSPQEYRRALAHVSALLNARGITAVTDASVSEPMLDAYRAAARAGELTVRVRAARRFQASKGVERLLRTLVRPEAGDAGMFREDMVKIFVDGDFPERNGALLQPYSDMPATSGEPTIAPAELTRVVATLAAAGYDLHFHAMGDRAVRIALDAVERARDVDRARDRRHQIAHLALVDATDLPRFRALGVIANLQLAWASPSELAEFKGLERLGKQRAAHLLPFAALAAHGATLVAGSDGPAPSFDPFEAMEIAARRPTTPGDGILPGSAQSLPITLLLQALTRNGAYAARAERLSGAIIPGHAADLVVLDRNLFDTAPERIGETRVLLTLLGGRAVHVDPGFAWPQ